MQQDPPGVAWHTRIFQRQGAGWVERLLVTTPVGIYPALAAVSADGSVAAIAWSEDAKARKVLRAYDVQTGAVTMQRTFDAQGNLANLWSKIDISADGSRFAASMWGDQQGTLPELSVYSPLQSDPIAEFPSGKTVVDLDLSNDGRHLLATRANGHVNSGYTAFFVQAYLIGSPDLRVLGTPSIGSSYTVEFQATPGSPAFLLFSPALARNPVTLAGVGTLQLDRSMLTVLPVGPTPISGVATAVQSIPADPNLIGLETHHQGFSSGPSHLTADFASVPDPALSQARSDWRVAVRGLQTIPGRNFVRSSRGG